MKYLSLIFLIFLITGCATKTEFKTIVKTKTVYLKPSDSILKYKITVPEPPDKIKFIQSDPIEREKMLTNYIIDLLYTIKKFKIKNNKILEWYNKNNSHTGK
jgi:PBP1b-binding outer membrane lipoprotein LpoB